MESLKQKKKEGLKGVVYLAVFTGLTYLSGSLPFIPSKEYVFFLTYIAFPILCIFFIYSIFFKKNTITGQSHFKAEIIKRHTLRKRLTYRLVIIIGIPFLSGIFSLLAQWYPAWPSQYLYSKNTSIQATIIKFGNLKKVNRTKIYLKDSQTGREYSVHWPKQESSQLFTGITVKLTGKQNWFGYYIDNLEVN